MVDSTMAQAMHRQIDDAADGACQRRCWERRQQAESPSAAGSCVAYSVSLAAHERSMCTMWDRYGLDRAEGDGNAFRRCSVLERDL